MNQSNLPFRTLHHFVMQCERLTTEFESLRIQSFALKNHTSINMLVYGELRTFYMLIEIWFLSASDWIRLWASRIALRNDVTYGTVSLTGSCGGWAIKVTGLSTQHCHVWGNTSYWMHCHAVSRQDCVQMRWPIIFMIGNSSTQHLQQRSVKSFGLSIWPGVERCGFRFLDACKETEFMY